ncbi:hypothetical protein NEIPOLOT_01793 [Neisseria polysaccharea ATCC 43768]|nr:hypothetical protein NEIPOLOT_01793 [Neisseria polysaccharea ATCC 43768]
MATKPFERETQKTVGRSRVAMAKRKRYAMKLWFSTHSRRNAPTSRWRFQHTAA